MGKLFINLIIYVAIVATVAGCEGASTKEDAVSTVQTKPVVQVSLTQPMDMVFVKGGCFKMGDFKGSGFREERPVHKVCVDDYSIGKYEVTQKQWQSIMGNNPSSSKECGENCPVNQVSWDDIQDFIVSMNKYTGKNYRLPTEAEWEYAARSRGKNELYAGTSNKEDLNHFAWTKYNSGKKLQPVGKLKPNSLGLYDMSGNVMEWCEDLYDEYYYSKSPQSNPRGPSGRKYRVTRGGTAFLMEMSTTFRGCSSPFRREEDNGFRLVLQYAQ